MPLLNIFLLLLLGLASLLYGMSILRIGLQRFSAHAFRDLLQQMTDAPWKSFCSGALVTAVLQSSTALTVMAVSFVDSGLMPFRNALGMILGSNIGSTVTTQLLALPLKEFIPYALLLGGVGYLFLPNRWRFLAQALLGLGMIFMALSLLENSMAPLADLAVIQDYLHRLGDHHYQGILVGTLLSALLHSSAATTGIVMLLTEDGWITLQTALTLIYGANIGTCFTAVLASLVANRSAQRVALFHVLLNVFGVLLFLPFLEPTTRLLEWLGGSPAFQVANAHTLFNVISSLVAFPLLPRAAGILEKIR